MNDAVQFDPSMTIKEIAARFPASIPVFNRFGFDTCCGGGVAVAEAARREGIDSEAVVDALREAIEAGAKA